MYTERGGIIFDLPFGFPINNIISLSLRKGGGRTVQRVRTPFGDCELFSMASQGHVQTLTLTHTRKVQGVMQMRQTRQIQINEDACIRN